MKSVMPKAFAMARLAGLMSTPTMRSAPTSLAPWMHVEADAAEAEDTHVRARLDARRPDHRADAGVTPQPM
jgi:hypothetical protein